MYGGIKTYLHESVDTVYISICDADFFGNKIISVFYLLGISLTPGSVG